MVVFYNQIPKRDLNDRLKEYKKKKNKKKKLSFYIIPLRMNLDVL